MTGTIPEYSDNLTETFRQVVRIKYDILFPLVSLKYFLSGLLIFSAMNYPEDNTPVSVCI